MEISSRRYPLALLGAGLAIAAVTSACGSSSSGAAGGGASTTSAAPAAAATSMAAPSMAAMPSTHSMSSMTKPAAGGSAVDVKNFSFTPMTLTVKVGTTVTWTFDDSAAHTVKASDGSFTSPALANGKTWSHTFTKAGTFAYICSIHQYMAGTIVVQ